MQTLTPKELEQADAEVHRQLYCLTAHSQHGEVIDKGGLQYTYGTQGTQKVGMVLFPALTNDQAAPLLDEMMDFYRARKATGIGCWSLDPPQPAELGARLLARGFQPGWNPCWMSRELAVTPIDHSIPPGITIRADNNTSTAAETELPYHGDRGVVSHKLMQQYPQRIQRFLAFADGNIVGQSCAFLTTGYHPVAGLFNVGVVPSCRRRGIGKALVLAACRWAKEQGYQYILFNATGREMYEQAGCQFIGFGFTWWLQSDRYITHPPSVKEVQLSEAVGMGDIAMFEELGASLTADDLTTPITNGMTLMELAVHCKKASAAHWLDAHGARYTPLEAWELGWKDRTAAMLQQDAALVNRQYGHMRLTLLHIAAQHNDLELADLALRAKPDLSLRDSMHHGRALDWAHYFGRTELAAMIQKNGYL